MTVLSIDIETYCDLDIKEVGLYRYVDHPSFEVTLFAYAFDDEPVTVIDLLNLEEIPEGVRIALCDVLVIKTAWNAAFERAALAKHFGRDMPPKQWRCSMVHSFYLGLPGSLDEAGKVLAVDLQKDAAGKALIKYFAMPCKPTKVNGGRIRNYPEHAPEKWQQFVEYCRRDVETEREIRKELEAVPVPDFEHRLWCLDQRINERGVKVSPQLVKNAIHFDEINTERLLDEARELTGLANPNSGPQLIAWLAEQGYHVESLAKDKMPDLVAAAQGDELVSRVLEIRQNTSKTSIKKYHAMDAALCQDNRLRGTLQFYGARRTGRWSGRIFQPQNLKRNSLKDLDLARQLVLSGDFEGLEMLFGDVSEVLSQLIRTALPGPLLVADFNAIEARVLAWLAGEDWKLDVFRSGGKIYEATAARMFDIPVEFIAKDSKERQDGKVAELACGYGGGPNALIAMGALRSGLTEPELQPIVDKWREANPEIVKLWRTVERAAIKAVEENKPQRVRGLVTFRVKGPWLFARLPNGRYLSYYKPKLERGNCDKMQLSHEGMNQVTRKWERRRTWGGTLVENLVQAISRDCLAVALERAAAAGYDIVLHVHDELVCEGGGDAEALCKLIAEPIEWAEGLPLKAEGAEVPYYQK